MHMRRSDRTASLLFNIYVLYSRIKTLQFLLSIFTGNHFYHKYNKQKEHLISQAKNYNTTFTLSPIYLLKVINICCSTLLARRHIECAILIKGRLVLVHCSDSQIGEIGNLSSKTLRLPTVNITVACLTNLTAFILARFPLTGWFYSHSRTLRNNWPIRSSCGGDDVKLTRVGAI